MLTAFFVSLSSSMLSVAVPGIVRQFQAGALAATTPLPALSGIAAVSAGRLSRWLRPGFLSSTAVVLTIVTAPLAARLRGQFFAGTASRVSHAAAS